MEAFNSAKTITVAQLIKALQEYPDHMKVMVEGYEGGYESQIQLSEHAVEKCDSPWYYGDYEDKAGGEDIIVIL